MEKFEKALPPEPNEGSGIRKKQENKTGFEASDQELSKLFKAQDKRLENYPDDPFEEVAPVTETDTAKVWGESENLDAEELEYLKKLRKQLDDEIKSSERLPEDEIDKAYREGLDEEIKKRSAS